jgi:ubiquinone/menaquinone biosynthesis C-methylase UbiE
MGNEIPILIENDSSIGYEKNALGGILKLPLMWVLALWVALKKKILGPNIKTNSFWFDGLSPICREVKDNATNWKALDIIYNYCPKKTKGIVGFITNFWNGINNIKAVRNRFRLVKKIFKEKIQSLSKNQNPIRLVSIASGSAQVMIEVIKEFKERGIYVKVVFLDREPTAIKHSKKLANQAGIIDQIQFVNKSTKDLEEVLSGFKPHIVEVTGLLEYRPDDKATNLLKRIYKLLASGGIVITSNISPTPESFFSYWVANWPMIYRDIERLSEIIIKAGFNPQNCKIIREPLKIHNVAVCKK